jgi:hypothetical protein
MVQIRSVYRTAELSQGYVGPLATNEATFYGLDTLPLWIAVTVYVFFWPGRFIDDHAHHGGGHGQQVTNVAASLVPALSMDGEGIVVGHNYDVEAGSVDLGKEAGLVETVITEKKQ